MLIKRLLPSCLISILFIATIWLLLPLIGSEAQGIEALDESAGRGMTLWQIIKAGGFIMIVLALISILAVTITINNFTSLKANLLVPRTFSEDIIQRLEKKQIKLVDELCHSHENIIARIVRIGLDRLPKGGLVAKEAMENAARKEVSALWQKIGYLSDIASIAPMIGLLGTVLGMIQAFNTIAFQTAVVKPILLAGGIGKAMITTATGLIVAIPSMLAYSYFRSKVQSIIHDIESYTSDIIKLISERSNTARSK